MYRARNVQTPLPRSESDFFAAIAQLIPILVLAIVVERRLWEGANVSQVFGVDLHLRDTGDHFLKIVAAVLVVAVIAVLFAGETLALIGLQGNQTRFSTYYGWEAVCVGAFALVWPILGVALRCLLPSGQQAGFDAQAGRTAAVVFLIAVVLGTALGLFVP